MTPPVYLSEQDFEEAVSEALDLIPPDLAEAMDNVVVLVQDEPDPDMLRDCDSEHGDHHGDGHGGTGPCGYEDPEHPDGLEDPGRSSGNDRNSGAGSQHGPPTLLGLYLGVPLTERDEGWSLVLPDRILIFRGPLQRWCSTREQLVDEIAITVIHEVAHHFGIDDARLHELGWG
ncbi:metallopeptidase family protein [Actinomyces wuliandei]|uniref:metallopeptidase family protein n=1 Tax=Actinomyces wuliandei TaxID=2057743 RepID=UPI00311A9EEA